ncbi:MAG: hypothetical protein R3272_09385 [Candidatus Promineifilaceae bacterium]|nr:hypothetical protein [Candidatus Promineifilaceae bacterium]
MARKGRGARRDGRDRRERRGGRRRRRGAPEDLEPYEGCPADAELGLDPLAVGWLERNEDFATGTTPAGFADVLFEFCLEPHTVCAIRGTRPCPICGQRVEPVTLGDSTAQLGAAEIRVLGEEDIFAAPDLIYHYVTEHAYRPPAVFVQAVLEGPQPGSAEHRALVSTLNRR